MLLVASSILLSLCCYHYHPYFGKESHSLRIHLCDVFVLMEHFLRFPPYVCVSVMETFRGRPLMLGECGCYSVLFGFFSFFFLKSHENPHLSGL